MSLISREDIDKAMILLSSSLEEGGYRNLDANVEIIMGVNFKVIACKDGEQVLITGFITEQGDKIVVVVEDMKPLRIRRG